MKNFDLLFKTPFLKCKKAVLITGGLFLTCIALGQSSENIKTLMKPQESDGFLYWVDENEYSVPVDHYQIDIYDNQGHPDSLVLSPVISFTTGNNYYRIPNEFLGGTTYYYQVKSISGTGDILDEDTPQPMCEGCYWDVLCNEICVGLTYAWDISVIDRAAQNTSNLPASATLSMARHDVTPTKSIPYPQYMGQSAWDQWTSNNPGPYTDDFTGKVTNNAGPQSCYRDVSSNVLTGAVYQVPLGLGPWENIAAQDKIVTPLSYPSNHCNHASGWTRRSALINLFNVFTNITPSLECQGGHGPCGDAYEGGDWDGGDPIWEYDDEYAVKFHIHLPGCLFCDDDDDSGNGGGGWNPTGNNGTPVQNVNEILSAITETIPEDERPENDTSDTPYLSDIFNFVIHPIDLKDKEYEDYHDDIELLPEDIFINNDEFDSVNIALEEGFYRVGVNFIDGSYTSIFFTYVDTDESESPLSDLLDVNLYPVPVQNQQLTVDLSSASQESLNVNYKLYNLEGVQLDSKDDIEVDENITSFYSTFPMGYSDQMLAAKFFMEDGSQKQVLIWVE